MAMKVVTQANPAAGADFTVTVPAGKFWRVHSVYTKLVTSATIASRVVKVFVDDGTSNLYQLPNEVAQTASLTTSYNLFPGGEMAGPPAAADASRTYPIPDFILGPGSRLRSVTAAIQAGDQWSEIALLVDEAGMEYPLRKSVAG